MQNESPNKETPQPAPVEVVPSSPFSVEAHADTPPESALLGGISKQRLILALAIAGLADVVSFFDQIAPPVQWGVDFTTAILLFVVLGFRWLLLPALIMEAIPGLGAMPMWVMVVGAIALWGTIKPKMN